MECETLEPDHYSERPAIILDMEEPEEALGRIIGEFVFGVAQYKASARDYYYDVMLANHPCPVCGENLRMLEPGSAACVSDHELDPTVVFQRSGCCGAKLVRRSLHYACASCGKTVPSRFLFDERVFDKVYFRQRMAESRAKARRRREMMRLARREGRSGGLALLEEPRLDRLPGFTEALSGFMGFDAGVWGEEFSLTGNLPGLSRYRRHILDSVHRYRQIMFSRIDPLIDNARRDRAMRFVALIFLLQDCEVQVTQYGSDIEIEPPYYETD